MQLCSDYRPFFTVYDSDFPRLTKLHNTDASAMQGLLLGSVPRALHFVASFCPAPHLV
jgi:hypothetical protein